VQVAVVSKLMAQEVSHDLCLDNHLVRLLNYTAANVICIDYIYITIKVFINRHRRLLRHNNTMAFHDTLRHIAYRVGQKKYAPIFYK